MTYSIKGLKTFSGMEGQGLNATLLRDGKPVAFVLDEGYGGEMRFDFRNPGQSPASYKATSTKQARKEEQAFQSFATHWLEECGDSEERKLIGSPSFVREVFVGSLVDAELNRRRFDRLSKKKTLFRLKGSKPHEWRTISVPYGPSVQAFLDKKYPGQIEAIWGVQK